MVTAELI